MLVCYYASTPPQETHPVKMQSGKSKQLSKSSPTFIKGGSGKMLNEQHTGAQKPGGTAVAKGASGGFGAKGGNGHMFGKQAASAQPAGTTGKGGAPSVKGGGRKRPYGGDENGNPY
jgi:hypothetical protein